MNPRWYWLGLFVLFDAISSHYPAIFYRASIIEPNPFTGFFLSAFGIGALWFMIPLIMFIFWVVVQVGSWYLLQHERYQSPEEIESVLLNGLLWAYAVIVIYQSIMLAGRFLHLKIDLLPFYWVLGLEVLVIFIYSMYIEWFYFQKEKTLILQFHKEKFSGKSMKK